MELSFVQEPRDTVTVRGGVLQLDCQAQSDQGAALISLKKDGVLLSTLVDERRQEMANGSLLVQNVLHSRHHRPDEGSYQCLATLEGLGAIVSRTAKVTVSGKRSLGTCLRGDRPGGYLHGELEALVINVLLLLLLLKCIFLYL